MLDNLIWCRIQWEYCNVREWFHEQYSGGQLCHFRLKHNLFIFVLCVEWFHKLHFFLGEPDETRVGFHNHLIRRELNPMLKAEYIFNLWIYMTIRCICKNSTVGHLKFGQKLKELTLRVKPWLWIHQSFITICDVLSCFTYVLFYARALAVCCVVRGILNVKVYLLYDTWFDVCIYLSI